MNTYRPPLMEPEQDDQEDRQDERELDHGLASSRLGAGASIVRDHRDVH